MRIDGHRCRCHCRRRCRRRRRRHCRHCCGHGGVVTVVVAVMAIVTIVTVVVMAARPPGRHHRTFGSWPVVMRIAQSGVAGAHETALQPIECALGMDVSAHEWSCAGEKNGDAH